MTDLLVKKNNYVTQKTEDCGYRDIGGGAN